MKTADDTLKHPWRWLGGTIAVAVITLLILVIIGWAARSQAPQQAPPVPACPSGTYWNTYYGYCAP